MHTTQEWVQHAHFNMHQAQSTHRKAHDQQERSAKAHSEVMSDNMGMYGELHTSLDHKVKTSQRLLDKLMHRAQSVENSLQHTRATLQKLEEALAAKEAPLALCMWRMEQRERRPLREQVRDTVEVCLEVEKATLIDAQRKLKDSIKKTRATIAALESKLDELRHDIQQKTQALSVDELCLRTTTRSFDATADRATSFRPSGSAGQNMPPSSHARRRVAGTSSARHEVAAHESARNEVVRQQEAVRLNQSAVHREEAAKDLRDEAAKLIQRMARAADEATAKSDKAMKDRVNENQQMRRRLENELRETCLVLHMKRVVAGGGPPQDKPYEEHHSGHKASDPLAGRAHGDVLNLCVLAEAACDQGAHTGSCHDNAAGAPDDTSSLSRGPAPASSEREERLAGAEREEGSAEGRLARQDFRFAYRPELPHPRGHQPQWQA